MEYISLLDWDEFLSNQSDAHLLQTSEWGKFKSGYGWKPVHCIAEGCGAQILFRKLPLGNSIGYIPKGPVGPVNNKFFSLIDEICSDMRAILLYAEPDCWENEFDPSLWKIAGFNASLTTIQPRRTIEISLEGTEVNWLERMKQKTRYNIRLAEKKGVRVSTSSRIDIFNQMMKVTGDRDVFGIHDEAYYQSVYDHFAVKGLCELLIAHYEETPLAAIMMFLKNGRSWYFYGASNNLERNRMPTYLLQFEAMRLAKKKGCSLYDLWGVPDHDEKNLEENFMTREDGLWGVYRFKRGFGGVIKRSVGIYEKIYRHFPNKLFQIIRQVRKREIQ